MATYINTKDTIGEQAALDGLIDHSLTEFTDIDVLELGQYAFYHNNIIKSITLPNVVKIGSNSFNNCSSLSDIHIGLEKSSMCTLEATGALVNTGRSIIFVPPNLVNTYKSGTNWSTYAARIYAEGDPDAPIWDESEITDTEAQIAERVNNGTAASYYKLGQYKSVNFGSFGTLRMQIIAKNTDELSDSSGYAQLTWFPMELSSTNNQMNPSKTAGTEGTGSIGGWDKSEMKSYLYDNVWPLIPSVWKNIIKEVKKYTRIYNTSEQEENDVLTNEKIFLLSAREVGGIYYTETQGPVYDFAFADSNTRIRKRNSSGNIWWLRTAMISNAFSHVIYNGDIGYSNSESMSGVCFGFCT